MQRAGSDTFIEIGLAAAIVAVDRGQPKILASEDESGEDGLPYGSFEPLRHRTLEIALRDFVVRQTGLTLGYVEQLYTFADRGRHIQPDEDDSHVVSIGYLALTRMDRGQQQAMHQANFTSWYDYFPWEDWRGGRPAILDRDLVPKLMDWANDRKADEAEAHQRALSRVERLRLCFGAHESPWDEEKVLERYELLYEAGLVHEAIRDGRVKRGTQNVPGFGEPMRHDHRRILATAMGRLRAKLKYRPVIFELMPAEFTLTALQSTVEAISGRHLHKQNFRRLVESTALVEPTGSQAMMTRGRPAALFRFRRDVLQERPAPGLRVGQRS